jgi:hypothetical protein
MSTPFIRELLTCMDVCPKPSFQGDVHSNESDVGEEVNTPVAEETMPTQAPEASGEVGNLAPSIGLLDLEGYVDMWEPCVKIGLYRVEGVCSRTKVSEHSEPRRPCAKMIRSWQRRPD